MAPPLDMEANSNLIEEIKEALRQYVIENPEATLTECVILVMGYGFDQASAGEIITLIGDKFEELYLFRPDFEQIKEDTITAKDIPIDEIDLTEIS